MNNTTYRIDWEIFINGRRVMQNTNNFTQKNFSRLLDFVDSYGSCIAYSIYECKMKFSCITVEIARLLGDEIVNLADERISLKDQATALNNLCNSFEVKDIKVNGPATIVFWGDGTKTVVKCGPEDLYDVEKAVAMCFMKKALGSRSMHKLFDLAEDRAYEYDNKNKKLEFTGIDTYLRNALSTFLNPNPGKISDLKVQDAKESDSDHISAFKPEEEKE